MYVYQKTELILKSLNVLGGHSTITWTRFYPILTPTLLNWTNMDILHTIYPLSRDPRGLSTGPHPPYPVHIVIECPLVWNIDKRQRICFKGFFLKTYAPPSLKVIFNGSCRDSLDPLTHRLLTHSHNWARDLFKSQYRISSYKTRGY